MPNTPGQIGHGTTGYLFAQPPSPEDGQIIEQILSSLGPAYQLAEEADLDRVTAIPAGVVPPMCLNLRLCPGRSCPSHWFT